MLGFLRENLRWLGFGFLLTFASAFGQTWFIALFAGDIKDRLGLTDGGWGLIYTAATLVSAAILLSRGGLADRIPPSRLAPVMAVAFSGMALAFAFAPTVWLMALALVGLRFCGQGMFGHVAMTAMGRWFRARRGRAVSLAGLGHPAGEALFPPLAVALALLIGWQGVWVAVAAALALGVAPALALMGRERVAQSAEPITDAPGMGGRHWSRTDALRHWLFPALLPILLTPPLIGTVVFFHQVHIAGVKGWRLGQMAPGYTVFAGLSVAAALAAGWAADRFGPHRLLPLLLLPAGLGMVVLGPVEGIVGWFLALALIGVTQGTSSALAGTLLPAVYGTRHLGAVRAMVTTAMVVATAVGPGVTGVLIDAGIDFPAQAVAMGLACFGLAAAAVAVQPRIDLALRAPARVI